MEIIVKNRKELKEVLRRTTDETAFVINFEEVADNESRRSEQPGAECDIHQA